MSRTDQIRTASANMRRAADRLDAALVARTKLDQRIRATGITPALAAQVDTVGGRIALAETRYTAASRALHALAPTEAEIDRLA